MRSGRPAPHQKLEPNAGARRGFAGNDALGKQHSSGRQQHTCDTTHMPLTMQRVCVRVCGSVHATMHHKPKRNPRALPPAPTDLNDRFRPSRLQFAARSSSAATPGDNVQPFLVAAAGAMSSLSTMSAQEGIADDDSKSVMGVRAKMCISARWGTPAQVTKTLCLPLSLSHSLFLSLSLSFSLYVLSLLSIYIYINIYPVDFCIACVTKSKTARRGSTW